MTKLFFERILEYTKKEKGGKKHMKSAATLLFWSEWGKIFEKFCKNGWKNHGNKIHFWNEQTQDLFMTYGRWWLGSALVKWPNLYLNQSAQSVRGNSHLCSAVKRSESDSCTFYGNELTTDHVASVAHELIMTIHVKCSFFSAAPPSFVQISFRIMDGLWRLVLTILTNGVIAVPRHLTHVNITYWYASWNVYFEFWNENISGAQWLSLTISELLLSVTSS